MRAGEQLSLERAGVCGAAMTPPTPPIRELVPGWAPAPTPWELGEQLDRVEAKLDRLLEVLGR